MKSNKIILSVSDREKEMIEKVCSVTGKNKSEFIRSLITDRFLKMFPPYKGDKSHPLVPVEDLTQEQICEINNGKLVKNDGLLMCEIQYKVNNNAYTKLVPLGMMGEGEYEVKGRNINVIK